MKKRTIIFLSLIITGLVFSTYRLYFLATKDSLQMVAIQNNSYNLKICSNRGQIYDCRNQPLLENKKTNKLVTVPNINTASLLRQVLSDEEFNKVLPKIQLNKPFCIDIGDKFVLTKELKTFKVKKRTNENNISPHILGYLDSSGNGVCGIEKAFNDHLNATKGGLDIRYRMDALGQLLPSKDIIVEDNMEKQNGGVILNIDRRLQEIAEFAAEKHIKKGAILITEVPNCEIRACVSMPGFSNKNINNCLKDESLPLINRALMPYNVGSVFKLVTAAMALETRTSTRFYNCTGEIEVDKAKYHCFNSIAHGNIGIVDALAFSCNTFFVNLAKSFEPQSFLNFIDKLGFGKSIELAPGMISSKGTVPSKKSLEQIRYMANLSFGQGVLMVTPLQVSGLINAVAADGLYTEPSLVKGLVNEKLQYVKKFDVAKPTRVFSKNTAKTLKDGMCACVEKGTGYKSKPSICTAALKTGTAQTGIKQGDRMILQGWCAGFFPVLEPKYSIVIFVEDAESGSQSCGPIFKKIIDEIFLLQANNS